MKKKASPYQEILAERTRVYQEARKKCKELTEQAEAAKAESTHLHRWQKYRNEELMILMAYLHGSGANKAAIMESLKINESKYTLIKSRLNDRLSYFRKNGPPPESRPSPDLDWLFPNSTPPAPPPSSHP